MYRLLTQGHLGKSVQRKPIHTSLLHEVMASRSQDPGILVRLGDERERETDPDEDERGPAKYVIIRHTSYDIRHTRHIRHTTHDGCFPPAPPCRASQFRYKRGQPAPLQGSTRPHA